MRISSHRVFLHAVIVGAMLCSNPLSAQIQVRWGESPVASVSRKGAFPWEYHGYDIVMSPGGRFGIIDGDDQGMRTLDANTGRTALISANGFSPRWSPDGRFIAFVRPDSGGLFLWVMPMNPQTGMPAGSARRVSVQIGRSPAWSPDGRQLAYLSPDSNRIKVVVIPFNGGPETVVARFEGGASGLAWSSNGGYLYWSGRASPNLQRTVRLEIASGKIDTVSRALSAGHWLGLSADGRFLAHLTDRNTPRLLLISDAATGAELERVVVPLSVNASFLSPTVPNRLIGSREILQSNIHAIDLSTGSVREITKGMRIDQGPSLSPDGTRIAFITRVGDESRVAIANADGSNLRIIRGEGEARAPLEWSPDGRYVAYTITIPVVAIHLIDVAAGRDTRLSVLNPNSWPTNSINLAWRSDSRAIRRVTLTNVNRYHYEHSISGGAVDSVALPDSLIGRPYYVNDSIVVFATPTHLRVMNVRASVLVRKIAFPDSQRFASVDVGSQAEWIALSLRGPRAAAFIYVASLRTGELRQIQHPFGQQVISIAMDPGGRYMIVRGYMPRDVTGPHLVQLPLNGDPPKVLTKSPGILGTGSNNYSLSADGRMILYDATTSYSAELVEITLPPIKPGR